MWRNTDVEAFTEWLRRHNAPLPDERRTGFYGLDLYNLNGSIRAVIDYLDQVDPEAAAIARERYSCLTPWRSDPRQLRAHGADRRLWPLRGAGRQPAPRPVRQEPRLCRA
jgi:erythromycin esterase-like protein